MLDDEELRALVEQWPAVMNVVRESECVPWREILKLVQAWINPQASFFPPAKLDDATVDILREHAFMMLDDLASASREHPGVQHRIGELQAIWGGSWN